MDQVGGSPGVSFVVRLWLERREVADEPEWRFKVIHVQSGEQTYGRSLADLLAFVERQAGVAGPRLVATPLGREGEEVQACTDELGA
ncbi:MAG: hypothetical protein HY690_20710 [Chloroflexi bacterium]|nr:hypothetical protein [Chloroflexota bacterium]